MRSQGNEERTTLIQQETTGSGGEEEELGRSGLEMRWQVRDREKGSETPVTGKKRDMS